MTATRLTGLRVLVLEDDFFLADDLRQALEAAGATVLGPCGDAASGFQALDRHHADCAVVDVNLGQGPSFEPARKLLARGVQPILVTGYDAKMIPPDLANLPCLQKPVETQRIIKTIIEICTLNRASL